MDDEAFAPPIESGPAVPMDFTEEGNSTKPAFGLLSCNFE
jgi:hypothetical protein